MDKKDNKPNIAFIGPYPPPYGGISIHIQRLKGQLEERGVHNCVIYELGKRGKSLEKNIVRINSVKKWLAKYFFFAKEDIIHCHASSWWIRATISLMGLFGKKVVISVHGASLSDSLKESNWFKKRIIEFTIKQAPFTIAINQKIRNLALSLGVKPERIEVIPSFIPPIIKKEEAAEIPQKVWDFISSHKPVICANASTITFYNNQDLYGIDMCIDLCAKLKDIYSKIGLIFCLPNIGDYEYFERMKQEIKEKKIGDNFLFQTKPCQLYPIIMKSDVFVRPTNIDGYGISVAEAIYFKKPAVASDVCLRPQGTILFKKRDINDFLIKVKDLLNNYERHKDGLKGIEIESYVEKILKVYRQIMEK